MRTKCSSWKGSCAAGGFLALGCLAPVLILVLARDAPASIFTDWLHGHGWGRPASKGPRCLVDDVELTGEPGGTWYWLRSPDEEKRVIAGLYNRYCIRCHGVDGRGVWDIPDVPDFTNPRWQSCRSDAQLARVVLEGRGAVMPPFRGTLTLEEAWGMARYLRSFLPESQASRPDHTDAPASKAGGKETEKPAETLPPPKNGKEPSK